MEKNAPKKKKRLTPLDIILYCISAALLIGGVALIIRQYVLISDYVDPPQPSITPTAVPTPTAAPNPSETPAPTAEPTPTPYQYTRSAPKKIYFIDAQVMAEVYPVGLIEEGDKKGQMDTIEDPDVAAWYEPGPAPGEQGNALVNGHKSWKGKIGRFSVLWNMEEGQKVAIEREDGSVLPGLYAVGAAAAGVEDDGTELWSAAERAMLLPGRAVRTALGLPDEPEEPEASD